jgi:hypothetical protein
LAATGDVSADADQPSSEASPTDVDAADTSAVLTEEA